MTMFTQTLLASKINPSEEDVNVQDFLSICDSMKYNINIVQSSGHHDTIGANFSIGAQREYRIKEHNFSSDSSFATKNKKDPENIFLGEQIVQEMSKACAAVMDFMK